MGPPDPNNEAGTGVPRHGESFRIGKVQTPEWEMGSVLTIST